MIVMRFFLLLLIFGNLLLYFWGQGMLGGQSAPGEPERLLTQLEPEKLRILAPGAEAPARPTPPAEATAEEPAVAPPQPPWAVADKSANICLAVNGLSRDQARVLVQKIQGEHGALKAATRAVGEPDGYWVMYPALPNRAQAERKVGELRGLGVTDLFLMNEESAYPNAISLGLFKSREKAEEHLKALREMGVRSARIILREGASARHPLEISGPREIVSARVARIIGVYRGATSGECQAGR